MTKYIDTNYKNQLKETLKESIFNALKGDADPDDERQQIVVPEGFTVVNGVVTGSPTVTRIDPLEPLEVLSGELANIFNDYITERIYLEILGYAVDDGSFSVTPGSDTAIKLNNVSNTAPET